MASPFPGMDPYIEATGLWASFHHAFLTACADLLNERLPRGYAAVLNERVQLLGEDLERPVRVVGPDVTVVHNPQRGLPAGDRGNGGAQVATLEPRVVPQAVEWLDVPKQAFVEVLALPERRVVTTLELLSPTNKRRSGEDRVAYLAKRRTTLYQRVHLVEVDLLLRGERLPMLAPLPPGDYFAFVSRRQVPHEAQVYGWGVRDPLPTIPIPLEPEHPDAPLDLAAAFSPVYARGRYRELLRYGGGPPAGMSPADQAWAVGLVASVTG